MAARKRIALIAHDNRKADLLAWARFNRGTLAKHDLLATGTTGALISEELGLPVHRFLSGPLGGDQQIRGCDRRGQDRRGDVLHQDPLRPHPPDVDVKALLRVAVVHNITIACNRATADFVLSGPADEPAPTRRASRPSTTETVLAVDLRARRGPELPNGRNVCSGRMDDDRARELLASRTRAHHARQLQGTRRPIRATTRRIADAADKGSDTLQTELDEEPCPTTCKSSSGPSSARSSGWRPGPTASRSRAASRFRTSGSRSLRRPSAPPKSSRASTAASSELLAARLLVHSGP